MKIRPHDPPRPDPPAQSGALTYRRTIFPREDESDYPVVWYDVLLTERTNEIRRQPSRRVRITHDSA